MAMRMASSMCFQNLAKTLSSMVYLHATVIVRKIMLMALSSVRCFLALFVTTQTLYVSKPSGWGWHKTDQTANAIQDTLLT